MGLLKAIFGDYSKKEIKRIRPLCDKVLALEEKYKAMSEEELQGQTAVLKDRLAMGESLDDILPDAFAVCREATDRVLGQPHYPVQILGAIILHQGRIAEMKTGEGKTQTVILPAYLNALTGEGVHVVTVNDYLARRDSEWMGKVYRYLGMTVGLITHDMEPKDRKAAYAADITYGTNNELGFDYLRDNMVIYKQNKVQRGHHYAIVDEVDSILIDEARTPLIISGQGDKSTELYEQADRFAKTLKMVKVKEQDAKEEQDNVDGDYIVDEKARTATLTQAGVRKAESHFRVENLMDPDNMTLLHHINQAVKANGVMTRDVDCVVKAGEVLTVKQMEYVDAARVIGIPNILIIAKHVLPNVMTTVIVISTMKVGGLILAEATLSFLGVGVPVTEPSLGMLVKNGFDVLFSGYWWIAVMPGLYIMLIVFGINLLGDFLRDEFNPKLK